MAGVITACIAIGVMAAVAVLAAIIAAVSTVAGHSKTTSSDEED